MAKIPEYFERTKDDEESKIPLFPFCYVEKDRHFIIGDTRVCLDEFDPYSFRGFEIEDQSIGYDDMTKYPALLPAFGGLIGGPLLHRFAANNLNAQSRTARLMANVYFSLNPDDFDPSMDYFMQGHMSFNVWGREYGGLGLQVLGDCACLGPNLQSYYIENGMENGFVQYDMHNVFTQSQRATIYAGIGHLASEAASKLEKTV